MGVKMAFKLDENGKLININSPINENNIQENKIIENKIPEKTEIQNKVDINSISEYEREYNEINKYYQNSNIEPNYITEPDIKINNDQLTLNSIYAQFKFYFEKIYGKELNDVFVKIDDFLNKKGNIIITPGITNNPQVQKTQQDQINNPDLYYVETPNNSANQFLNFVEKKNKKMK